VKGEQINDDITQENNQYSPQKKFNPCTFLICSGFTQLTDQQIGAPDYINQGKNDQQDYGKVGRYFDMIIINIGVIGQGNGIDAEIRKRRSEDDDGKRQYEYLCPGFEVIVSAGPGEHTGNDQEDGRGEKKSPVKDLGSEQGLFVMNTVQQNDLGQVPDGKHENKAGEPPVQGLSRPVQQNQHGNAEVQSEGNSRR